MPFDCFFHRSGRSSEFVLRFDDAVRSPSSKFEKMYQVRSDLGLTTRIYLAGKLVLESASTPEHRWNIDGSARPLVC